jgi:hypothetical protein
MNCVHRWILLHARGASAHWRCPNCHSEKQTLRGELIDYVRGAQDLPSKSLGFSSRQDA